MRRLSAASHEIWEGGVDTDGDNDHDNDLDEIRDDEGALGQDGRTEGHPRADHKTNAAAEILDGQADDTGDGERDGHTRFIARSAVGDEAGDRWGDDVAHEVTHSRARNGAQCTTPTCKDGQADEAQHHEEESHEKASASTQNEAREDDYCILQNNGHTGGRRWDGDKGEDNDERSEDGGVRNVESDGILFHGPKLIQSDKCAANGHF